MKEREILISETELKYLIWALSREGKKYEKTLEELNDVEHKRKMKSSYIHNVDITPKLVHELEALDEELRIKRAEFNRLGSYDPIYSNGLIMFRLQRLLNGSKYRRNKGYMDTLESMIVR